MDPSEWDPKEVKLMLNIYHIAQGLINNKTLGVNEGKDLVKTMLAKKGYLRTMEDIDKALNYYLELETQRETAVGNNESSESINEEDNRPESIPVIKTDPKSTEETKKNNILYLSNKTNQEPSNVELKPVTVIASRISVQMRDEKDTKSINKHVKVETANIKTETKDKDTKKTKNVVKSTFNEANKIIRSESDIDKTSLVSKSVSQSRHSTGTCYKESCGSKKSEVHQVHSVATVNTNNKIVVNEPQKLQTELRPRTRENSKQKKVTVTENNSGEVNKKRKLSEGETENSNTFLNNKTNEEAPKIKQSKINDRTVHSNTSEDEPSSNEAQISDKKRAISTMKLVEVVESANSTKEGKKIKGKASNKSKNNVKSPSKDINGLKTIAATPNCDKISTSDEFTKDKLPNTKSGVSLISGGTHAHTGDSTMRTIPRNPMSMTHEASPGEQNPVTTTKYDGMQKEYDNIIEEDKNGENFKKNKSEQAPRHLTEERLAYVRVRRARAQKFRRRRKELKMMGNPEWVGYTESGNVRNRYFGKCFHSQEPVPAQHRTLIKVRDFAKESRIRREEYRSRGYSGADEEGRLEGVDMGLMLEGPKGTKREGVDMGLTLQVPEGTKREGVDMGLTLQVPEGTKREVVDMGLTLQVPEGTKREVVDMGLTLQVPKRTKREGVDMGLTLQVPKRTKREGVDMGLTLQVPEGTKREGVDMGLTLQVPEGTKREGVDMGLTLQVPEGTKREVVDMGLTLQVPKRTKREGVDMGLTLQVPEGTKREVVDMGLTLQVPEGTKREVVDMGLTLQGLEGTEREVVDMGLTLQGPEGTEREVVDMGLTLQVPEGTKREVVDMGLTLQVPEGTKREVVDMGLMLEVPEGTKRVGVDMGLTLQVPEKPVVPEQVLSESVPFPTTSSNVKHLQSPQSPPHCNMNEIKPLVNSYLTSSQNLQNNPETEPDRVIELYRNPSPPNIEPLHSPCSKSVPTAASHLKKTRSVKRKRASSKINYMKILHSLVVSEMKRLDSRNHMRFRRLEGQIKSLRSDLEGHFKKFQDMGV